MKTVVITDVHYRSAIAAIRALGRDGWRVVAVEAAEHAVSEPPAFFSKYVAEAVVLEGSTREKAYGNRLLELLRRYDMPVLLCIGAVTLNLVSARRDEFAAVSRFLIASPERLDAANDKEQVQKTAAALGLPVPKGYSGEPEQYPVILKPHCGEKAGLKAQDRYVTAGNPEEYRSALEKLRQYDPNPLVQEKVLGDGIGVSLLLGRDGSLLSAICHRRIREYPVSGGPSTCCESFYDEALIRQASDLLSALHFTGIAMVEFKGPYVLEINPRIWGSFPMTDCCGTGFILQYARAAAGEQVVYQGCDYQTGVRMRFLLNDTLAGLAYLRKGRLREGFGGLFGFFRAREALRSREDPKPFRRYLRCNLLRR